MTNRSVLTSFFTNDHTMLVMVIINTITTFIGGFGKYPELFLFIDSFFTVLFVCEAISKIRAYGWKDYWKDNWNKFDFIVTLIALPSLSNLFVGTSVGTSVLLSLRTLRVFKSFRLLKFIPNINSLLRGVKLAIKASIIVTIAFAVLMLIISILSCAFFGKAVPELFGDPGMSLFTTFRLFTGDGWSEIPINIVESGYHVPAGLIRVLFSFLFFAGGILGLSLVNSIFVDAMASDNNDDVMRKLNDIEEKLNQMENHTPAT